jgi:hypothetical protein
MGTGFSLRNLRLFVLPLTLALSWNRLRNRREITDSSRKCPRQDPKRLIKQSGLLSAKVAQHIIAQDWQGGANSRNWPTRLSKNQHQPSEVPRRMQLLHLPLDRQTKQMCEDLVCHVIDRPLLSGTTLRPAVRVTCAGALELAQAAG